MNFITESKIIYIIKNPDLEEELMQEQRSLLEKISKQSETLESIHDEIIGAISLKGRELKQDVLSRTNNTNDGVLSVMEQAERIQREYYSALQEQFCAIVNQLEMVQRVRICFDTLDSGSRAILNRLYRHNEKWDYIEKRMEINHRALVSKRSYAIKTIKERYSSKNTMRELGRMKNRDKEEDKVSGNRNKEIAGQLNLFEGEKVYESE